MDEFDGLRAEPLAARSRQEADAEKGHSPMPPDDGAKDDGICEPHESGSGGLHDVEPEDGLSAVGADVAVNETWGGADEEDERVKDHVLDVGAGDGGSVGGLVERALAVPSDAPGAAGGDDDEDVDGEHGQVVADHGPVEGHHAPEVAMVGGVDPAVEAGPAVGLGGEGQGGEQHHVGPGEEVKVLEVARLERLQQDDGAVEVDRDREDPDHVAVPADLEEEAEYGAKRGVDGEGIVSGDQPEEEDPPRRAEHGEDQLVMRLLELLEKYHEQYHQGRGCQ